MSKTVVFDFDKTLTYKDSLSELFLHEMRGCKYPLRAYYVVLKVLSKSKIITVRKEKEKMIQLLFGSDNALFERKCREQAHTLLLSPLFDTLKELANTGERVIVLSASSIYLLEEVFKNLPAVEIIGTDFMCRGGKIQRIDKHPFSIEKYELLSKYGVGEIDEMFYDSPGDECLIPLCKKWHKVKDGVIIKTGERTL